MDKIQITLNLEKEKAEKLAKIVAEMEITTGEFLETFIRDVIGATTRYTLGSREKRLEFAGTYLCFCFGKEAKY